MNRHGASNRALRLSPSCATPGDDHRVERTPCGQRGNIPIDELQTLDKRSRWPQLSDPAERKSVSHQRSLMRRIQKNGAMDRQPLIEQMCRTNHQSPHAESNQIGRPLLLSNLHHKLRAELFKRPQAAGIIIKNLRRPAAFAKHVQQRLKPPGPAPDPVEHECLNTLHHGSPQ